MLFYVTGPKFCFKITVADGKIILCSERITNSWTIAIMRGSERVQHQLTHRACHGPCSEGHLSQDVQFRSQFYIALGAFICICESFELRQSLEPVVCPLVPFSHTLKIF
jgi:hypothetical protein